MYLLDSNVWITFLRKPHSPVVPRLQARMPAEIRVCSVVVGELYYGCLRSAKPGDNRTKVDALIAPYSSLAFDDRVADRFATLRRHLETLGTPIGPYDLQIAAIALVNSCTLVTHNTAEFSRVQDFSSKTGSCHDGPLEVSLHRHLAVPIPGDVRHATLCTERVPSGEL